jgi:acyl-coenzyme A thioesterase PaaI-like protein
MPDDAEVLTVELKVNVLAPARSDSLVADGEVVRAGRALTVCRGDAYAEQAPSARTWRRCWRQWCVGARGDGRGPAPPAARPT